MSLDSNEGLLIRGGPTRLQGPVRQRSLAQRLHIDPPLLLGLLLLSAIGLMVLYSASGQNSQLLLRQGVRLLIAFTVMIAVAQISPRQWCRWTPWFYGLSIALLLAVLAGGVMGKGAQRWLDLGVLRFQPSEILKLTVPMMLSAYLAERRLPPRTSRILIAGGFILIPTALIAMQPDLGTALLVAASGIFVLFLAGMSWRLIAGLGACAAVLAPVSWFLLHDYQRQRIVSFLNPEQDPLGAGYHLIQSKIAIGSGGLYGKGWLNGTQAHLEFLPERSTDFIFAVLSEEFGLFGAFMIFAVFLLITVRGLQLALQSQEPYGRLLGGALVLTFFVYVVVNIGMVTGVLPVVGVPLPLVSYGGTSMVSLMAAFGILMSAHTHRRLLSEGRRI